MNESPDPFSDFSNVEATFSLGPAPVWAQSSAVPWDTQPQPEDHVLLLLSHTQWAPARFMRRERSVRRLISREAVQRLSQIEVEWDPAVEELIIHEVALWRQGVKRSFADRRRFLLRQRESGLDQHLVHGRMSAILVLDDVRVDDSIELEFSIHAQARLEGEKFDAIYATERSLVTGLWEVAVHLPKDHHFTWRAVPPTLEMEERVDDANGEIVRSFRGSQAKAIELDGGTPCWVIPHGHFQFSGYLSWHEVARCVGDAWSSVPREHASLSALAHELTADLSAPMAKAQAIIHWVQEKVRYLGMVGGAGGLKPNPPHLVQERRYGDCKDKTLLLCTLLNLAGIQAKPILVHTIRRQAVQTSLPGLGAFDHVIATYVIDGKRGFADATTANDGGGPLGRCLPDYAYGLVVNPGSTELLPIPWLTPDRTSMKVTEDFHLHRKLPQSHVDWRIEATGADANALRARLAGVGGETFAKVEADDLRQHFHDAKSVMPAKWKDDLQANRIIVWGRTAIGEWANAVGKARVLQYRPRWIYHSISAPPREEKRSYPFALSNPVRLQHVIRVHAEKHSFTDRILLKSNCPWFQTSTKIERLTKRTAEASYAYVSLLPELAPTAVGSYWTQLDDTMNNQMGLTLTVDWKGPANCKLPDNIAEILPPAIDEATVTQPQISLEAEENKHDWLHRVRFTQHSMLETVRRYFWSTGNRISLLILGTFFAFMLGGILSGPEKRREKRGTRSLADMVRSLPKGSQVADPAAVKQVEHALEDGDFIVAATQMEALLNDAGDSASLAAVHARVAWLYGNTALAKQRASDALRLDPDSALAKTTLGEIQLRVDNTVAEAERVADALTTSHPDFAPGWIFSSEVQARQGRLALAEKAAQKALSLAPRHYFAHLALMDVHAAQADKPAQARAAAQGSAAVSKPAYFDHWLSVYHYAAGRSQEAVKHAREAVKREPRDQRYRSRLAEFLSKQPEDAREALALVETLRLEAPIDASVRQSMGLVYGRAGDFRRASESLRMAVVKEPTAQRHNDFGYSLLMDGKSEVALAEFQVAVELDSTLLVAWENLATAYKKTGNSVKQMETEAKVRELKSKS